MSKGKTGRQIGEEYVQRAKVWKSSVERAGTMHEYAYAGRVKRREFASECGFSYSVCTQNDGVRAILESCDRQWYGTAAESKAAAEDEAASQAASDRAEKCAQSVSAENNKLKARIAQLEAENQALKAQKQALEQKQGEHETMERLIMSGMAGFGGL
jgi:hypothetical protein